MILREDADLAEYDLFMEVRPGRIRVHHAISKIGTRTASNIAHTMCSLSTQIIQNPRQPIGSIDMISERDLTQLKNWLPHVRWDYNDCVHDLALKNAQISPHAQAIWAWDGTLSFNELRELSFSLAAHLVTMGVRPEMFVAVCFEKSLYAIVAMLAILKAGGALVVLDPSHPRHRLELIVQKAQVGIVLTSPQCSPVVDIPNTTRVIVSKSTIARLDCLLGKEVDSAPSANNAAFVLFTSGSTGEPKGIVQEHGSVVASCLAHGEALQLNTTSCVLQYAAFTFDVSMMDIFTTLIFGGCVCIPSEEIRKEDIIGFINSSKVNWALLTPSVAALIQPEQVPGLKTLVLGGEAVTQDIVRRWAPSVTLFNCYGPAESAATHVHAIKTANSRPEIIGWSLPTARCWVVRPTDHNQLVPIGAIGELLVEGSTLARGYLNDVERTDLSFISHPSWSKQLQFDAAKRFYKTGDLVRQNPDGSLNFVGRKDFQVKIRGQRVELQEIEKCLSTHDLLCNVVVCNPSTGPFAKSLVAVVRLHVDRTKQVKEDNDSIRLVQEQAEILGFSSLDIREHVAQRLPPYMVPQYIFSIDFMPLTASGKVDRKRIMQQLTYFEYDPKYTLKLDRLDKSEDYSVATMLLKKIESMIPETQAMSRSGHYSIADMNLLHLGMGSIQLMSLCMFIRTNLGVQIKMSDLLQSQATIEQVIHDIAMAKRGTPQTIIPQAKTNFIVELQRYQQISKLTPKVSCKSNILNVFVTGATGYLGSRILQKLCLHKNMRIIALVRADDREKALRKIMDAANLGGWWSEAHLQSLEVWLGDLALPGLGLQPHQLERLNGEASIAKNIHVIIHSGAHVNWTLTFEQLRAENVDSTWSLLVAAWRSQCLKRFIYVSGGYFGPVQSDIHESDESTILLSTGYSETKYLSQMLVEQPSSASACKTLERITVKPNYIIGSARDGMANVDDYLWRVVASCVEIHGYNEGDDDRWLYIADVEHVATQITSYVHNADPIATHIQENILDGMPVKDFWGLLREEFGFDVKPLKQDSWLAAITTAVEKKQESHALWPLMSTIEKTKGHIGHDVGVSVGAQATTDMSNRTRTAVRKNIEYLCALGLLPGRIRCDDQSSDLDRNMVFARARKTYHASR